MDHHFDKKPKSQRSQFPLLAFGRWTLHLSLSEKLKGAPLDILSRSQGPTAYPTYTKLTKAVPTTAMRKDRHIEGKQNSLMNYFEMSGGNASSSCSLTYSGLLNRGLHLSFTPPRSRPVTLETQQGEIFVLSMVAIVAIRACALPLSRLEAIRD